MPTRAEKRAGELEGIFEATAELVAEIKPILANKQNASQGSALADLVALYFAGHHPKIRDQVMEAWMRTMLALIHVNEAQEGIEWNEEPDRIH